MEAFTQNELAGAFKEHGERLLALVRRRLNPILLKRLSPEDVLQEAFAAAAKRLDYFDNHPDVPVYLKLRTILLQTLTDFERRNLAAAGRDAFKEEDGSAALEFAADVATSPLSRADRLERHSLLRVAIAALPETDRSILALRHFDGLGNAQCAAVLGISEKVASLRHVRALERLQKELERLSCFKRN